MYVKAVSYYFLITFLLYILFYCIITKYILFKPLSLCVADVSSRQELLLHYDYQLTGEEFDFEKDTLALLHIQKTSGSAWEKHILEHLHIKRAGVWKPACVENRRQKRKVCVLNADHKSIFWDRYMSRFCDIHADYTELKNCVMHDIKNRISSPLLAEPAHKGIVHFMTFLRDPVRRYISEFEHVKRGATWFKAVRTCKDQELYSKKCFKGESWKDVDWESFLGCEYNLANNRQVRMLANYNILGCNVLKCWTKAANCSSKQKEFYDKKLLQSAKHTLIALPFFGLTEYQKQSEYLFLKTFDENRFKFSESIVESNQTTADLQLKGEAGSKYLESIRANNKLDIQLYEFAVEIFFKKVNYFKEFI